MVKVDPAARITAKEIRDHHWVRVRGFPSTTYVLNFILQLRVVRQGKVSIPNDRKC